MKRTGAPGFQSIGRRASPLLLPGNRVHILQALVVGEGYGCRLAVGFVGLGGDGAGFRRGLSLLEVRHNGIGSGTRSLDGITVSTQPNHHHGPGRELLRPELSARRYFRRFSSDATGVVRNPSMRADDVRRDVPFHQFIYRTNPDKTIDAICAFCYLTAATAETHAELRLQECAHRCPRG
jgi:hypothetical protein